MAQQGDTDDRWTPEEIQEMSASDDMPLLSVETIETVEPLDGQLWEDAPKTVPDALYAPLFGQPEPTGAEIMAAGGDAGDVPPMQTYAILDAAKLINLPELLETSRLEYRCLFKGDAHDELKDVAPYIVRLQEGNTFARRLFSVGKAPWFMWDKGPGIYVRSRGSLVDMWRHFRKFTRVQDGSGKWFYFRFWEGLHIVEFLAGTHRDNIISFWHDDLCSVHVFHDGRGVCVTRNAACAAWQTGKPRGKFRLTNRDMEIFADTQLKKFAQSVEGWLEGTYGAPENIPKDRRLEFLKREICIARTEMGLGSEKAISEYVAASWLMGTTACHAPELAHLHFGTHYDSLRKVHAYVFKLKKG